MKNTIIKIIEQGIGKDGVTQLPDDVGSLCETEYDRGRNQAKAELRAKAPEVAQEILDSVVENIKEPLENAFYECNLKPEEAEEEAKRIIKLLKK